MIKYNWTIRDIADTYIDRSGKILHRVKGRFITEAEAKKWMKTQDPAKVKNYFLYAHKSIYRRGPGY